MPGPWLCSQFGSREKYAVPRALALQGQLSRLYTDLWIPPRSVFRIDRRVRGRYHPELRAADVRHFNARLLVQRVRQRLLRSVRTDDDRLYDRLVARALEQQGPRAARAFFAYSYAALESLKRAQSLGLRTVLGQINPGPAEAEIVVRAFRDYEGGNHEPTVPNNAYWDRWRLELDHSDVVMVNSEWSRELLVKSGVPLEKLRVVPLAYVPRVANYSRQTHANFGKTRPLRLLYLGGVGIRKGFHVLKDAMRDMSTLPVTLDVVGELKGPRSLLERLPSNVRYHGARGQHEVDRFYRDADIMVFPTLSDGFGITQLEAQAYKLPVITTPFCARVVTSGHNGWLLEEVTPAAIRNATMMILSDPECLARWSAGSLDLSTYSIRSLAQALTELVQ